MPTPSIPRSELVQAFRASIATTEAKTATSALWLAAEAFHAVGLHHDAQTVQDALLMIVSRRAYFARYRTVRKYRDQLQATAEIPQSGEVE